jgi:protein O-GlcNAc transferase
MQDERTLNSKDIDHLIALFRAQRYAELEHSARALSGRHPESGFAWSMLGTALKAQGKDALQVLQRAAQLLPEDAVTHYNLGHAWKDIGRLDEAMASYRRALDVNPNLAEAYNNLGGIYSMLWQLDEAIACYRRALEIRPDFAGTYFNLGSALKDAGRIEQAISWYQRALALEPGYVTALSDLLFAYNYLSDLPAENLVGAARHFGRLAAQGARCIVHRPDPAQSDRCLRIGLVSGDLRNHPVGHFVEGVLTALSTQASDRLQFFAYFNHASADSLTEHIKVCCQGWNAVAGWSDESLAQRIRDDGIDILLDLSGHTACNRLTMFAWRPAPVQASWLGYFATTGVAEIDYFLADHWTAPEAVVPHFTEKIWRLPDTRLCFTPPDVDVAVSILPALHNGHITFGCFNNLSKVNDAILALWSKIMLAVPHSRLFLKAAQLNEDSAQRRIAERLTARGIHRDRLIMEGAAPRADYLAAYNRVDIALDPFPYTGGATTVDALWMGVPVLTLGGDRFIARQGLGLLANAGLAEWVASDTDDYAARAIRCAGDLPGLASLRGSLRQQVLQSPIFDAARFARHFETALRGMWREWCERS